MIIFFWGSYFLIIKLKERNEWINKKYEKKVKFFENKGRFTDLVSDFEPKGINLFISHPFFVLDAGLDIFFVIVKRFIISLRRNLILIQKIWNLLFELRIV